MGEVTYTRHSYIVRWLHCYIVTWLGKSEPLNTEQGQEGLHTLGAQSTGCVVEGGGGGMGDVIRNRDISAAARVCYNLYT